MRVDPEHDGKALHLFEESRDAYVRYLGEATYLGHHETIAPDTSGTPRRAVVFELALDEPTRSDGGDRVAPAGVTTLPAATPAPRRDPLAGRSLDELRSLALQGAARGASAAERRVVVRQRSDAVKAYVRRRANGVCEGCQVPAPFMTSAGAPYLEPHHIRRLADGGPDHPRWVAALCPNCHRRVHHGGDGAAFNLELAATAERLETAAILGTAIAP